MMKRITIVCLVLVLAAGSALAGAHPGGIARMLALGGSGYNPTNAGPNIVLNPFIQNDPTVMLLNPAYQNMYRDYAWMNIAGGAVNNFNSAVDNGYGYGKQFAGVNFAFGKELALGMNLSFDPSFTNFIVTQLASFVNAVRGAGTAQTGLRPIDVFEAVASYDLGGMNVGFAFTYGWSKNTNTNSATPAPPTAVDNELSARLLGFRAGIAMDLGGGMGFDADAAIRMDKATDNMGVTLAGGAKADRGNYSASATEIQVDARFHMKMSNKVNFVPYASFFTLSGEPKQDAPATGATAITGSVKVNVTMLAIGAGMEYKVNNFYFAGGVSFKTAKLKQEQNSGAPANSTATSTATMTSLPTFNLGVEWTMLDWLIGRMGYYRAFQSINSKTENSAPGASSTSESNAFAGTSTVIFGSYNAADNSLITLGLGLKFGNFALDGTVSEEALRRGLGLIGSNDNMNTFGYLTASYCFE
jgi:hypothetical protein